MHHKDPLTTIKSSEICIAPKTIAIVLKQRKDAVNKRYTGDRLFALFKRANSGCSWNQQLHQAIRKVVFVGHLRPHTLLVYGTSDHIEALRSAWIKNILIAPDGFSLLYFGELPSLCIETVCATNFTPLPDALCSIILQMNRRNKPATVSSIKVELESHYRHVQPPSDQVVFEALNSLMREKKLCLADTGYYISSEAHNRPVSFIISNQSGEFYAPVLLPISPSKNNNNNLKTSPRKNKPVKPVQTSNDIMKYKNIWNEEENQNDKKSKVKDKAGALKKLFGIKPKTTKKRSKSGGSAGTSSGCSSSHSPPLSNDDEEAEWHQPISKQQYMLDPRSVSQLTSARVPFEMTTVPNNTINDSLRVHCGATIIKDPCPSAGSDYETDEEAEVDDYVPEMHHRPIRNLRNHRHRATTHLLKRPITNPTSTWKKYHRKHGNSSASTTDTEGGQIPTAKMYFERKKYRTMSYHSTRNSTRLSASQREGNHTVLHPNLSSINMCMSTVAQSLYVPDNSTIHSTSPSLPGSQNTRESADGQTNTVAHTSTPKDDTGSNSKLRTAAFNATGHSQCLSSGDCCRQGSDTPKRSGSRTLRSKAMSTRSTEVFCDCVNPQQCSCSTSGSDVNSKPVALVRNRLSQEVSL